MPRKYMVYIVNVYMVKDLIMIFPVSPPLLSESQPGHVCPCCPADEPLEKIGSRGGAIK